MNKKFTLIELVVSIVVLGILLSIVLLKLTDMRKQAVYSAVSSNTRILQTAVDTYYLEKEVFPIKTPENLSLENPQLIDVERLSKEGYLKKELDTKKVRSQYYWVDVFGAVWGSTEEPVKSFNLFEKENNHFIEFLTSKNTEGFNLYEVKGLQALSNEETVLFDLSASNKGNVKSAKSMRLIDSVNIKAASERYINFSVPMEGEGRYVIASVDKYGLESAPFGNSGGGTFKPILRGDGVYYFEIESEKLMLWLDFLTIESLPGKSSISYLFRVKDEEGNWLDWVNDFDSLPNSKGIQVEISMKGDEDGNYPSLYDLYVKYDFEGSESNKRVNPANPKGINEDICSPAEASALRPNGTLSADNEVAKITEVLYFDKGTTGKNALIPSLPELNVSYQLLERYYWYSHKGGPFVKTYDLLEIPEESCVTFVFVVKVPTSGVVSESNIVCPSSDFFSKRDLKNKKERVVYKLKLKEDEFLKELNSPSLRAGMSLVTTELYYVLPNESVYKQVSSILEVPSGSCVVVVFDYDISVVIPQHPSSIDVKTCQVSDKEDCRPDICSKNCLVGEEDNCTYFCSTTNKGCTNVVTNCQAEDGSNCLEGCISSPEKVNVSNPEPELWQTVEEVRFFAHGPSNQPANWYKVETDQVIYNEETTRIKYYYSKSNDGTWSNPYEEFSKTGRVARVMAIALIQVKIDANVPVNEWPKVNSIKFFSSEIDYFADSSKPQALINMTKDNNKKRETISDESILTWEGISYDRYGFEIVEEEWNGDKRDKYPVGTYSVFYRVKNELGVWSNKVEYKIVVVPEKPVAVISIKNSVNANSTSLSPKDKLIISGEGSYDPDGDKIANYQWENKKESYEIGSHVVRLRVQDTEGYWSDWVEEIISISGEFYKIYRIEGESEDRSEVTPSQNGGIDTNVKYSGGKAGVPYTDTTFLTITFTGTGFDLMTYGQFGGYLKINDQPKTSISEGLTSIRNLPYGTHTIGVSSNTSSRKIAVDYLDVYSTNDKVNTSGFYSTVVALNGENPTRTKVFSPNLSNQIKVYYVLDKDAKEVVSIYNENGSIVHQVVKDTLAMGGSYKNNTFLWDGKTSAGEFVSNGNYVMKFEHTGANGTKTVSEYIVTVENEVPFERIEGESDDKTKVLRSSNVTVTDYNIASGKKGAYPRNSSSNMYFYFTGTGFDIDVYLNPAKVKINDGDWITVSVGKTSFRNLGEGNHTITVSRSISGSTSGKSPVIDFIDVYK